MSPEDRQLIKHAQAELIALCGGANKVATLINFGRTTVYRWADVGDPSLMPGNAFLDLQRHCRTPVVTMAYASLENRLLTDPAECDGAVQCVYTVMAETMVASGALSASYGTALADGAITANEMDDLDEKLGIMINRATSARRANSAARARGSLKVVGQG